MTPTYEERPPPFHIYADPTWVRWLEAAIIAAFAITLIVGMWIMIFRIVLAPISP